ncbi:MAG: EAL and GGDEF domain-containing protein [Firmicutes bacterium]|nr:EAL and GGDEF domain-containing protein [Bacillota bacterium]
MSTIIRDIHRGASDLFSRRHGKHSSSFQCNYTSLVNKVKRATAGSTAVGLIFIDIKNFHEILQLQGLITANRILLLLEAALRSKMADLPPGNRVFAAEHLWADDFVVLLGCKGEGDLESLLDLGIALRLSLKKELSRQLVQLTGQELELHLGCSLIKPDNGQNPELKLYNALREAQRAAKGTLGLESLRYRQEFLEILANKQLSVVYQPIVSLTSGEMLGWEALARGPENSYFSRPDLLFNFAEEVGLLFPAEKVCREKAISCIGDLDAEQKLFLNVHPRTMSDPNFIKGETLQILRNHGLAPRNIVFEITERHSIGDFSSFKQLIENYRSQGYRIAIDDVGAGFSGLQTIAEIRPDFIKIDMSLVRNIDSILSRQAVVEALISLAGNINSRVVAEGVETQQELNTLLLKGVHYAQGYYLARPEFPRPTVAGPAASYIRHRKVAGLIGRQRYMSVGDLAVPVQMVEEETTVSKVKELLEGLRQPDSCLVVVRGQETAGLVMKQKLYRTLSSLYGISLYFERHITEVMDHAPLILESYTTLEQAAELAMNRDQDKLYDDLVVVDADGALIGVVSIQRLFETLARLQIELAKGMNPLTGLPGNLAIEEELSRRARHAKTSSVIYVDLDRFKSYNDTYGFKHGDHMIVLLAKIIAHCTSKYGGEEYFVGHIGGDDLIVITIPEYATQICRKIMQLFDRLVGSCFSAEDRARKAFYGQDRFGRQEWLPLTSVTMAIVECEEQKDYGLLAETAAQLKKQAKAIPGSIFVRDRRAKR